MTTQEMTKMKSDSNLGDDDTEAKQRNALLHKGGDDEKCSCYRRWNNTQFILFTVIVVVLSALLGGIFSNIDRMGGDNDSSTSSSESEEEDYCVNGWFSPPADYKGANTTGWTWSYDPSNILSGPGTWNTYYPQCGCPSQSPRNIDSAFSRSNTPRRLCDAQDGLLQWNFDKDYIVAYNGTYEVRHNEHTIQMQNINFDNDSLIPIAMLDNLWQPANSTLHSQFRLEQIHFHWGNSENGSPHTIDGKHYPLSIHFVHYSADYDNIGSAFADAFALRAQNKDYHVLAVVGIFFEIDETNSSYIAAFDQLLSSEVLNSVNDEDVGFVEQVNITEFLPHGSGDYYYYDGSITTPPCFPIVRWHLLANPLKVNANQISKFRSIANETISYNTRAVQENDNPVYVCHADFF